MLDPIAQDYMLAWAYQERYKMTDLLRIMAQSDADDLKIERDYWKAKAENLQAVLNARTGYSSCSLMTPIFIPPIAKTG